MLMNLVSDSSNLSSHVGLEEDVHMRNDSDAGEHLLMMLLSPQPITSNSQSHSSSIANTAVIHDDDDESASASLVEVVELECRQQMVLTNDVGFKMMFQCIPNLNVRRKV